ncbi:MAG TPA: serine/threonine-protein kinase, partial [Polyangiaceae bacterium]|nr:serine/threonine-protein kinase [Polyangiaceae bacterium]
MTRQNREPLEVAEDAPRRWDVSGGEPLQPTSWSIVHAAAEVSNPESARDALLELARRYRAPVRAFILSSGYSEPEADALTARFFRDLERPGVLQGAARVERFRIWLLDAVRDFLLVVDEDDVLGGEPMPQSSEQRFAPLPTELLSEDRVRADGQPPLAELFAPPAPCTRCGSPSDDGDTDGVCWACLEKRFDRYENLKPIGEGGEALVYRAWDPRDGKHVALKLLKLEHVGSPEVVQRFLNAIGLAKKLDHPNIVRVCESGVQGGRPFHTMPLITGGTLAQALRQERFRDPEQATCSMIDIARAVQYAHQHGVLHRDLSPANVLLDEDGKLLVSDFMARRIGEEGAPSIVGKLDYMAPEQARGHGATVAADVYGLGAIFYELLTGRSPVSAKSLGELREKHGGEAPPSARASQPRLNRDLDAICSAALHPDPARRHRSAALFADSLERV